MRLFNRKYAWIVGLIVFAVSLILLWVGVKVVLGNPVSPQNVIAYVVLSLILGGLSTLACYIHAKVALVLFLAGICIGFVEMYRMFINGLSGWGDLVGFMSLLAWTAIGLAAGVVVQLVVYVTLRMVARKKDPPQS